MTGSRFDVVVLGSGLAGSITATILARHGLRVAMLERGSHPRMAIGESLIPTSAMWFWILGQKHQIPEISTIAHLDSITANVEPSCGVKRGFGYVYHREGQRELNPDESSIFIGAIQPIFKESQLYRQDVDAYLVRAAQRYGVDYREQTTVEGLAFKAEGVRVQVADGEALDARVVVDATGRHSLVARELGLRESPSRLRHRSRTIFSHLRGVPPFEDVAPEATRVRRSAGWSEGTLHHVFDGGWFWIIPFGNHAGSTSGIVSVGLTLDLDKYPRDQGLAPEDEFWRFVDRFPRVAAQLRGAEVTRPFVGTDRIQYSSTRSAGERYVLLHHAYGFIDPLFSRGIWRSLETIDAITTKLVAALADDDLGAERFEDINRMQAAMLDDNDKLIANAYRAMASYDTWTAWLRVWFADELMMTLPVLAATFKYTQTGDPGVFRRIDGDPRPGMSYSFAAKLDQLIDESAADLERVAEGALEPAAARDRIVARLQHAPWLPNNLLDWGTRQEFSVDLTPPTLAKLLWWSRQRAPAGIRREAFDFSIRKLAGLLARDAMMPGSIRRDGLGNVVNQG